jgi:hypothetical protein
VGAGGDVVEFAADRHAEGHAQGVDRHAGDGGQGDQRQHPARAARGRGGGMGDVARQQKGVILGWVGHVSNVSIAS